MNKKLLGLLMVSPLILIFLMTCYFMPIFMLTAAIPILICMSFYLFIIGLDYLFF
jgi:hypothetical protein